MPLGRMATRPQGCPYEHKVRNIRRRGAMRPQRRNPQGRKATTPQCVDNPSLQDQRATTSVSVGPPLCDAVYHIEHTVVAARQQRQHHGQGQSSIFSCALTRAANTCDRTVSLARAPQLTQDCDVRRMNEDGIEKTKN